MNAVRRASDWLDRYEFEWVTSLIGVGVLLTVVTVLVR